MMQRWVWLGLLLFVLAAGGCSEVVTIRRNINATATTEAERYPWSVYPISEESKAALCEALGLPAEDEFCQPGTKIRHWDVYRKVVKLLPPGRVTYAEVEAKLSGFPHIREESRHPNGTLVGLRVVYQLTEYEGACIYFQLDLSGTQVERIYATTRDTWAPQRPK